MNDVNKRLQSLARTHCAAFVGCDGCRYQPNSQPRCQWYRTDEQAAGFLADGALRCFYFEKHVLPIDPALEVAYWNTDGINERKCESCGVSIVKKSNRQKYCVTCAADRRKASARDGMAKLRGKNTAIVNI